MKSCLIFLVSLFLMWKSDDFPSTKNVQQIGCEISTGEKFGLTFRVLYPEEKVWRKHFKDYDDGLEAYQVCREWINAFSRKVYEDSLVVTVKERK